MSIGTTRRSRPRTRASGLARRLLAAAFVLGAVVVLTPAPALAAPCWGMACTNLDPDGRCSATWTEEKADWHHPAFWVQLRYSSACNAFWARGQRQCYHSPPGYLRLQRQVQTPWGTYTTTHTKFSKEIGCDRITWSVMVGNEGSDRHRACIAQQYDGRHPSEWPDSWWSFCTRWVTSVS